MKIVFVSREGFNLSGIRIRCYGFARELQKYGIKADVFSFGDILGAKYGEEELQMPALEKSKLIYMAFKKLVRENKESIFYIQRFNYHSFAPLLVHLFRKNKIIFDMDDWDMRENCPYYFGFYPSSKSEYLTRKIAKLSATCIGASRYLFNYLKQFNKKVYYIPTGVDVESFDPNLNKGNNDKIIFSWTGTVFHREIFENVVFIIDCFSALLNKYPHINLEITGWGKYFKEINKIVAGIKTNGKIVIKTWIHPMQMPDYLATTNIGLVPLIQNTRFNLAKSPTKLFEYMAMAKPVIASDIGEAGHIIQDGFNGFLANSKEGFIRKMEELILNQRLREDMGNLARKTVEREYSLTVLGKSLYGILQDI